MIRTREQGSDPAVVGRGGPGAVAPSRGPLYLLAAGSGLRPFKAWKSARVNDALPFQSRVRRPHRDSRGDNGWSLGGAAKGLGLRIGRDRRSLTWGEAGKQARTHRTVLHGLHFTLCRAFIGRHIVPN